MHLGQRLWEPQFEQASSNVIIWLTISKTTHRSIGAAGVRQVPVNWSSQCKADAVWFRDNDLSRLKVFKPDDIKAAFRWKSILDLLQLIRVAQPWCKLENS